ncbi:MAG: hypothetical protein ACRDO1_07250 [Nocardioidaceae bacterium]
MNSNTRILALAAVATAVATVGAGAAVGTSLGDNTAPTREQAIVIAHGSDRLPNQTASDWVTYADHVVVVTPRSEKPMRPSKEEVDRGEGLILREVTFSVDDVLWSRPGADQAAPDTFAWTAYGWQFTDGDLSKKVKMAGEGEPRIEGGHQYVMAIEWQEARCSPGDVVPAQWRGLGADSTLPYDGNVIGQGEVEGKRQSVGQAREAANTAGADASLEDAMAGRDAAALDKALRSAKPVAKQQFGPPESKATC